MSRTSAAVTRDLIFDLGAFTGDDSAYYLHLGYRVVAVEPNPLSVALLRDRFAREIADGRLSLEHMAISDAEGEAPFWVCDDVPGWSSFDRAIASYRHTRHHQIRVPTCHFSSLVARFGVPFYCKIDIEGSDRLCLQQMTENAAPRFVSIELPTVGSAPRQGEAMAMMDRLESLGYTRFKVISQMTFRQPGRLLSTLKASFPLSLSGRLTILDRALRRQSADPGWTFGDDSSGPFGENTRGSWLSPAEARRRIAIVQRNVDALEWYDLHAAMPEVA